MPFQPSGGGGSGNIDESQFLKKATYDTNDDGVVEAADKITDGTNDVVPSTVINHINNNSIHHQINDSTTSTTELWSSDKVNTELAGKANISHTHAWNDISKVGSKLSDLGDVSIDSAISDGQVLAWDGANLKWKPITSSGGSGGASSFLGLSDTPDSYAGMGSLYIKVKPTEDGIEFTELQTTKPELDKYSVSILETGQDTVTISNYDANLSYEVESLDTSIATVSRSNDVITIAGQEIPADVTTTVRVRANATGLTPSDWVNINVSVANVPSEPDDSIIDTTFSPYDYNDGF